MAAESSSLGRLQVVTTEMNEADQIFVIETASNAVRAQEKGQGEGIGGVVHTKYHKHIAEAVKKELDQHRGGTWNVIVGKSFGAFVTHESKT